MMALTTTRLKLEPSLARTLVCLVLFLGCLIVLLCQQSTPSINIANDTTQVVLPNSAIHVTKPSTSLPQHHTVLSHHAPIMLPTVPVATPKLTDRWLSITVQPGQTISLFFQQQGFSYSLLQHILQQNSARDWLTHLVAGQVLHWQVDATGQLKTLLLERQGQQHIIHLTANRDVSVETHALPVQLQQHWVHGSVQQSIPATLKRYHLSAHLMWQLGHIFSWKINVAHDLHPGDHFNILYQRAISTATAPAHRDTILAASITTSQQHYVAVRFPEKGADNNYYDAQGHSLQTHFLRYPLHFKRISSPFSLKGRYHPVLHIWRPHLGIDLAAPIGTRIYSVAPGKILFRGWEHGFGRVVIMDHGHGYTTLYAHMSRFAPGEHKGSLIKRGQTIGFVGQSGLATGPHCHFEFRHHGVHYDPAKVALPQAANLRGNSLKRFRQTMQPWLAALGQ